MKEKYYTIEEITKKFSFSKDNVNYWVREGKLKIYISETDLQNFLDQKKKDDERSLRRRKETESRYQEKLKKTPKVVSPYKKYKGEFTEL